MGGGSLYHIYDVTEDRFRMRQFSRAVHCPLELPAEGKLEVLTCYEDEPLGVMVRGYQLNNAQMCSLIVRDILLPAKKQDGSELRDLHLYNVQFEITRNRWVGVDTGDGVIWQPREECVEEDVIVQDEFDVTVAYSEELCAALQLLTGVNRTCVEPPQAGTGADDENGDGGLTP